MKEKIQKLLNKMAVISDEIAELQKADDIDAEALNAKNEEYNKLKAQVEALEKSEEVVNHANSSGRQATPKVVVGEDLETKKPFDSAGDFLQCVHRAAFNDVDKRLRNDGAGEFNGGEDGGFLIPPEFISEIQKKITGEESLLGKTKRIPVKGNSITLPVNESAAWDSTTGGVQSYWTEEQGEPAKSKAKFGHFSLRAKKLATLVKVTDELLEDAGALEAWLDMEAADAMIYKINKAILSGSGVGTPKGIINCGFTTEVAKEGSQAADTFLFENAVKMYYAMLPKARAGAEWYVHPDLELLLPFMKFDTSATNPVPAYLPANGISGLPYATLFGRPVKPMMGGMEALGDKGDIIFANLGYYLSIYKEIKKAMSIHVYFETDETAFRFTKRLDGGCPFKAPITPENGTVTKSGLVTLAERA